MSHPPITIRAFGVDWRLQLDEESPESYEELRTLWARCIVPADPAAAPFIVWRDDKPEPGLSSVLAPTDQKDVPYVISRAITLASIKAQTGRQLMLHAAGLASADGERFVALVAPSGTGKSTAARVLGTQFGYVSDETIALTQDLIGLPYPKPISTIRPGGEAYDKEEHSPDDLGLGPTPKAPRLAATVLLRRDADCAEPQFVELDLIEGILGMIDQSSAIPRLPNPLDWLARAATAGNGPFELRYREIADCAPVITELLERPAETTIQWQVHPPSGDQVLPGELSDDLAPLAEIDATSVPPIHEDDVLRRGPWTDALSVADEVLLLQGSLPIRLQGLGDVVWLVCAQPQRAHDLVDAVRAELGEHPEAHALVMGGLRELVAASILEVFPRDE